MTEQVIQAIKQLDKAEAGPGLAVIAEQARAKEEAGQMRQVWKIQGRTEMTSDLVEALEKTAAARLEAIERSAQEHLAAQLPDLRAAALEALDAAEQAAHVEHYRASQTFDQWEKANARATFVSEDIRLTDPVDIPAMYQVAQVAGDDVGAWLILRYGSQRLEALVEIERANGDIMGEAASALWELQQVAPDQGENGLRKTLASLDQMRVQIERARGTAETGDARREFAARYNVQEQYLPDVELAARQF